MSEQETKKQKTDEPAAEAAGAAAVGATPAAAAAASSGGAFVAGEASGVKGTTPSSPEEVAAAVKRQVPCASHRTRSLIAVLHAAMRAASPCTHRARRSHAATGSGKRSHSRAPPRLAYSCRWSTTSQRATSPRTSSCRLRLPRPRSSGSTSVLTRTPRGLLLVFFRVVRTSLLRAVRAGGTGRLARESPHRCTCTVRVPASGVPRTVSTAYRLPTTGEHIRDGHVQPDEGADMYVWMYVWMDE